MFEEEYRKEMEAVGPDREQMERLLAAMEQKGRRPRPLRRTILLVAAACAAMVMTVVASTPTLRDTLEEFLGGFAPYAQPVEAAACTANGIEIKVISAMADRARVKVYAQARDVTGQNRLRADMDVWGGRRTAGRGRKGGAGGEFPHNGRQVRRIRPGERYGPAGVWNVGDLLQCCGGRRAGGDGAAGSGHISGRIRPGEDRGGPLADSSGHQDPLQSGGRALRHDRHGPAAYALPVPAGTLHSL